MNRKELVKFLEERKKDKKKFGITFTKRSTGESRKMNAQYGVRKHLKGGDQAYEPKDYGLSVVFDHLKKDYRSFGIDSVTEVRFSGKVLEVKQK